MRVEIEQGDDGSFRATGLGVASAGESFESREVIDLELVAKPSGKSGSAYTLADHVAGVRRHGRSTLSPRALCESFATWWKNPDRLSDASHIVTRA